MLKQAEMRVFSWNGLATCTQQNIEEEKSGLSLYPLRLDKKFFCFHLFLCKMFLIVLEMSKMEQ